MEKITIHVGGFPTTFKCSAEIKIPLVTQKALSLEKRNSTLLLQEGDEITLQIYSTRKKDISQYFISLPGDSVGVSFRSTTDSTVLEFFETKQKKLVTCTKTKTSLTVSGETLDRKTIQVSELEFKKLLNQFQNYINSLEKAKQKIKHANQTTGTHRCPRFFILYTFQAHAYPMTLCSKHAHE